MNNMNNIKCYVINLKRCPEKKNKIIDRLDKYPILNYEIIEAIDGLNIDNEYMDKNNYNTLDIWTDPNNNRNITLGEIGCSLSHYSIYKKIYDREDEISLILEDDAMFCENFDNLLLQTINKLNNLDNWDMIYLSRKKITEEEEKCIIDDIYKSSYSYWTIGYIVNKKFCEKIINDKKFLNNIIPIDEYLPLIGNISPLDKYKNIYEANIFILALKENIISPEPEAFQNSDTEIMKFLKNKNKNNKITILTVATDKNDPLERFEKSCNIHNLKYKILGLGKKWTGGDMKNGPGGGMKLNLLKEELKDYNDEDIILFSDSYDVIFISNEEEIYEKYLSFNTNMLFSAEKACWPDINMSIHFNSDSPYKYLNSGGFIGNVKSINKLISGTFEDTYDDQLLIQKNYVKYKDILNIKLDTKCIIFQTSSNDIDILYNENRIKNNIFNTKPCHYHGNGGILTKIRHNNICNYLLMEWNPIYDYISPKININYDKVVYIFINIYYNNLQFYDYLKKLKYPKENLIVHINTSQKINKFENIFKNLIITNTSEVIAREISFNKCIENNCDYYLNYDNYCIITNELLIEELIKYDKNIVSPLLTRKGLLFSNFWGDIDDGGWYNKSFNYMDIIYNNHIGCWNVPYINNIYLIKAHILNNIIKYYSINYDYNRGYDMAFCENLRRNNYYMYICNENYYGYLLNDDDIKYNNNLNNITIYDYKNNKKLWKEKYLHKEFGNNIKEPINDVIQFPLVNNVFCKEIIEISENYGKWSGATHKDSRIGHENVPSNDIHLTELKLNDMWEEFIIDNIAPLVSEHWGHYKTKGINIAFIVKYKSDEFYKLEPHHDASSYTLNICLNDDFKGGSIHFVKKNKKIDHIKNHGIIHPGRVTHYHEGLIVTEGTKYILVSFID
jgi:GR25 family glycosyltransferase involved in LPS biosynthesis